VSRSGTRLSVMSQSGAGIYFPAKQATMITPVGPNEFLIDGKRHDWLRFERDPAGRVTGLAIDPGQWQVAARKRY